MDQQYSLKAAFKLFVEKGGHSVTLYLNQLHEMDTFVPLNYNKLTKKVDDLASLMLLTEKKYGRIKGRTSAGGRKR